MADIETNDNLVACRISKHGMRMTAQQDKPGRERATQSRDVDAYRKTIRISHEVAVIREYAPILKTI